MIADRKDRFTRVLTYFYRDANPSAAADALAFALEAVTIASLPRNVNAIAPTSTMTWERIGMCRVLLRALQNFREAVEVFSK